MYHSENCGVSVVQGTKTLRFLVLVGNDPGVDHIFKHFTRIYQLHRACQTDQLALICLP